MADSKSVWAYEVPQDSSLLSKARESDRLGACRQLVSTLSAPVEMVHCQCWLDDVGGRIAAATGG